MRPPGDLAYHRSRAAHYRAVIDGTAEDSYDSPDVAYYFHLEQAGDWDLLRAELTARLEVVRSQRTEAELRADANAFDLVVRLVRCCEGAGDGAGARAWYGELRRFDHFLTVDRIVPRWDPSFIAPKDPEYEAKILNMEREAEARGEIALERRSSFAERMMQLGELAVRYGTAQEAGEIFEQGARLFEPYAFNVRFADTYLLHDLYLGLRAAENLKHLLMWLFLRDESFLVRERAFLLGRLGLMAGLEGKSARARRYFHEAGSLVEHEAEGERGRYPLMLARAALLFGRAGSTRDVNRISAEVVRALRDWYPSSPLGDWGCYGEHLRRVLVAAGQRPAAEALALEMAGRYEAEIPRYYDEVREAGVAGPSIVNPHLGLYFCRGFLGDREGALESLARAGESYRTLGSCVDTLWDDNLGAFKYGVTLTEHLRWKTLLGAGMDSREDVEAAMAAFRAMASLHRGSFRMGWMGEIIEDELYEFQQLLTTNRLKPLRSSGAETYVTIDEVAFLANAQQARVERSRPKDMKRALAVFRRRWSREGWSNAVVTELARVYREKGFDVTAWPEDALLGFKMLLDRGRSLDIVYSREFSERTIVGVLQATARGVIDS